MHSKNNKKTILITGASGFIGNALYVKLKNENYNIIGLDNFFRGKNLKNQTIIKGSIFDKKILKKLICKSDIIIHLVAINGTRNFYNIPDKVFEVSMRGAMILYDCLNEIGDKNKKILLASSGEVYGEPKKIPTDEKVSLVVKDIFNNRYSYGGGKICQDLIARYLISKVVKECIIFRPHNVYGPNMGNEHVIPEFIKKMKSIKNKSFKIQGSGNEIRSFIYIEDFINAFDLILHKGKHLNIYNIGTNEKIKIKDLAKKIAKIFNKKIEVRKSPLKEGGTKIRVPNIKKIKMLGFKTKYSLDSGLNKILKLNL